MEEQMEKAKDNLYRLAEMLDEMKKSSANAIDVIEKQERLIAVLDKSDEREDFEEFIKAIKEQIDGTKEAVERLEKKIQLIESVLKACEDEDKKEIALNLMAGLGAFEE